MKSNLHIVITGERDQTRSYVMPKSSLTTVVLSSLAVVFLLALFSFLGFKHSYQNVHLKSSIDQAQQDLHAAQEWNKGFEDHLAKQIADKESEFQGILEGLNVKSSEREELLNNALSELKSRSEIVESILKTVGIKTSVKENSKHSGGPFKPLTGDSYEDLLFKFDHSLDIIKSVPLGPPVLGSITSLYGRRIDPINEKVAFHSGIDISDKTGTEIITTAHGKIVDKGYTEGNGNYVVVGHGKGFKTRYLHMKKSLVEKNQQVKRGQVIGLVGNSGRSTGPHLHYEILYNGKSVNPLKFVRVARNMPSVNQ
ncbi:MAG: M23 family metallopeptidase [Thermodesulfobacteriota bacterium]